MTTDTAWDRIHAATPPGGLVCRPSSEPRREVPWSVYAFDQGERPKVGPREPEWTAVGMTEEACLEEMARCMAEIREGRVPR